MYRRVCLERDNVLEGTIAYTIMVERITELGIILAITR
jgi:hypothetical protein